MAVPLEGVLHVDPLAAGRLETVLDQAPVRLNVEIPVPELGNLTLLLAHHDGDPRLRHPVELAAQSQALFTAARGGKLAFEALRALGLIDGTLIEQFEGQ
ncbi:MAG: hypothetical protein OXH96_13210, partial [Spirochaetaceae bacterium]|nr:hypothetical protein [Spirochaetaceae bacterium]